MSNTINNYKAYFNAFDESNRDPKIPGDGVYISSGLKVRDNYVLKVSDDMWPKINGQYRRGNIFVSFHPSLRQNLTILLYVTEEDGTVLNMPYLNSDGVVNNDWRWRILKVGNNGTPFQNLYYGSVGNVRIEGRTPYATRACRVVSGAIRLSNVGLQVSDIVEVKTDYALPCTSYATYIDRVQDFVMPGLPSNIPRLNSFIKPWVVTSAGERGLGANVILNYFSWENAPFHVITPSGSLRGMQVNAIPVRDDRPFRRTYEGAMLPFDPSHLEYTQGGLIKYTPWNIEYVDEMRDPDFMGVSVQFIKPTTGLEVLIETCVNYEMQCYPGSAHYTLQCYNDNVATSLAEVRDVVEKVYGTLFAWDDSGAKMISAKIEEMLKNVPVYGSTVGMTGIDKSGLSRFMNIDMNKESLSRLSYSDNFNVRRRKVRRRVIGRRPALKHARDGASIMPTNTAGARGGTGRSSAMAPGPTLEPFEYRRTKRTRVNPIATDMEEMSAIPDLATSAAVGRPMDASDLGGAATAVGDGDGGDDIDWTGPSKYDDDINNYFDYYKDTGIERDNDVPDTYDDGDDDGDDGDDGGEEVGYL